MLEMVVAVREATVVVMAVVMAAVEVEVEAAAEVVMLLKRHQKIPHRWMNHRPPVANNRGCVNY